MDTYMIIIVKPNRRECVQSLYRNSISTSTDFGDCIYCRTLEDAEALRRLVILRSDNKADDIKILKTVTTEEII